MNDFRLYKSIDYSSYLAHFGVGADDNPPGRGSGRYPKGSGKRPNQHEGISERDKMHYKLFNSDATLTKHGKRVLKRLPSYRSGVFDSTYKDLKEYGVTKVNGTTDRLKAGARLSRFTSKKNEPIDTREKYVFLTDSVDEDLYDDFKDDLGGNRVELVTTKDLKVANAKVMADALIKKFGDMPIGPRYASWMNNKKKDQMEEVVYDVLDKLKDVTLKDLYKLESASSKRIVESESTDMAYKDEKNYLSNFLYYNRGIINDFFNDAMMDIPNGRKMVLDELRSQGYDAVVDAEDKLAYMRYPIIILNPEETLKKVSR